jgi:hypothetical protein
VLIAFALGWMHWPFYARASVGAFISVACQQTWRSTVESSNPRSKTFTEILSMKTNPQSISPVSALRFPDTIEILEARIAPAVLIAANGHSASYTDVDGDHVTIAVGYIN